MSLKYLAKIDSVIELVKNDIDKNELQNNHHHVIGLQNINIDIPKNKIQVFMGLSGSEINVDKTPKSTIRPTTGEIIVNNINVTELNKKDLINFRRENFAMVFQKFALYLIELFYRIHILVFKLEV